jgi:hypothetical protein
MKEGRDPAAGASALMRFSSTCGRLPGRSPNGMEVRLSAILKTQPAVVRKPAPGTYLQERPSPETLRLLGAGDLPILILRPEGAQRLLELGLTPPVLRIAPGQGDKALMSATTMAVAASMLIVVFETGHRLVTRYANRDIVTEVLS